VSPETLYSSTFQHIVTIVVITSISFSTTAIIKVIQTEYKKPIAYPQQYLKC